MLKNPKIGIVGLGTVGTPLRQYLESKGLRRGKNLFLFDADPKKGFGDDVRKADVIFICVPTPVKKDGSCDTRIVESVIKRLKGGNKLLVIKSTIEPGTAYRLWKKFKSPIFFSPEFLTEANAWNDFIKPERQIVGHTNNIKLAEDVLRLLPPAKISFPSKRGIINAAEAEIGKYGANVFGALKVSYGNMLADLCKGLEVALKKEGIKTKIEYSNVKNIIGHDKRIGHAWLDVYHGNYRGFGGHCFPKDMSAFMAFAKKIEKKLSMKDKSEKKLKILIRHIINFLEAGWKYNEALLDSQGLSVEKVSRHNHELKLKKRV